MHTQAQDAETNQSFLERMLRLKQGLQRPQSHQLPHKSVNY